MEKGRKEQLLAKFENGDNSVYEEVKELYEKALVETPTDPIVLFEYGILQEIRGIRLLKQAAGFYEAGLNANHDTSYNNCSSIKHKLNCQLIKVRAQLLENEKTIEFYKNQIAENPENPQEYCYLASAYLHADQVQEAQKVIEAGLKISSSHAILNCLAGDVYSRLGLNDKALVHWQKAWDNDTSLIDVRFSRAFLFQREEQWKEAAKEWRYIIKFLHDNELHVEAKWPEKELAAIEGKLKLSK